MTLIAPTPAVRAPVAPRDPATRVYRPRPKRQSVPSAAVSFLELFSNRPTSNYGSCREQMAGILAYHASCAARLGHSPDQMREAVDATCRKPVGDPVGRLLQASYLRARAERPGAWLAATEGYWAARVENLA